MELVLKINNTSINHYPLIVSEIGHANILLTIVAKYIPTYTLLHYNVFQTHMSALNLILIQFFSLTRSVSCPNLRF